MGIVNQTAPAPGLDVGRPAVVPIGALLVRVGYFHNDPVGAGKSTDLQADGQSLAAETTGHRDSRGTGQVENPCV